MIKPVLAAPVLIACLLASFVLCGTLFEAASDVYSKNLALGVHQVGFSRHWDEELQKLQRALKQLEETRQKAQPRAEAELSHIAHVPVRRHTSGGTVPLRATISTEAEIAQVQVQLHRDGQLQMMVTPPDSQGLAQSRQPIYPIHPAVLR